MFGKVSTGLTDLLHRMAMDERQPMMFRLVGGCISSRSSVRAG